MPKPNQSAAELSNFASPPPMTLVAKRVKQMAKTIAAPAMCIPTSGMVRPENGARRKNEQARIADTRLGIVIVNRSENAAIARHSGKIRNIAASIIVFSKQLDVLGGSAQALALALRML